MGLCLALVLLLSPSAAGQSNRSRDVFSEEQLAIEFGKLRQMSAANKSKVGRALDALEEAILTASVATDMEEAAKAGNKADDAVDACVAILPNGVLKGAMVSSRKALGHSYFLRILHSGRLDPDEPRVANLLEEIMLRYQLAGIPRYERPAKLLDWAKGHLNVARLIASHAGVIPNQREQEDDAQGRQLNT